MGDLIVATYKHKITKVHHATLWDETVTAIASGTLTSIEWLKDLTAAFSFTADLSSADQTALSNVAKDHTGNPPTVSPNTWEDPQPTTDSEKIDRLATEVRAIRGAPIP